MVLTIKILFQMMVRAFVEQVKLVSTVFTRMIPLYVLDYIFREILIIFRIGFPIDVPPSFAGQDLLKFSHILAVVSNILKFLLIQ